MAESTTGRGKKRSRRSQDPAERVARGPAPNPRWFVPVMLTLMIIGLLWVVTYYLTAARFPVEAWGNWNLVAGFAFVIAGFLMTTRWR